MPTTVDSRYYTATHTVVRQAANSVQTAWKRLDTANPDTSWGEVAPVVVEAIERGQARAVSLAASYVAATLLAAGSVSAPLARLVAAGFAGVSAAGAPLLTVVDHAAAYLRRALAAGVAPSEARALGLSRLLTYTSTEVTDAARTAVAVAMITEPEVTGYERVVHLPACGRCILLSGRVYRYSQGFLRHPRCDCSMKPVTHDQHDRAGSDPGALFARMTVAQQDTAFGTGDATALRAGADMARVVNAHRPGLAVAGGRTRRGRRPTAAQLVASSNDRDELLANLHRFGYLR